MTKTVFITYTPSYVKFILKDRSNQIKLDKLLDSTFFYNEPDAYFNNQWQKGKRVGMYDRLNKKLPFGFAKDAVELLKSQGYTVKINNQVDRILSPDETVKNVLDSDMIPRWYQLEAVHKSVNKRYGVVEAPCGAGKTLISSKVIASINANLSIYVTDGAKLVSQTAQKMKEMFPQTKVVQWGDGCKAKLEANEDQNIILVTTYQSLAKNQDNKKLKQAELVIVDECHRVASECFSTVARVIENPYMRIGLSATPERENEDTILIKGYLGETIYKVDPLALVKDGFLCQPVIKTINFGNISEDELKRLLASRKTLIFTEKIADVEKFQEDFPWIDSLTGKTPAKQFKQRLQQFKEAENDCLVCTRVLDTGIDIPDINTVMFFSIHKSKGKAEQAIGRATRPFEGKKTCEVFFDVSSAKARKTYRILKDELFSKNEYYILD